MTKVRRRRTKAVASIPSSHVDGLVFGSGGGCFPSGTLIHTLDGTVEIQDVAEGTWVSAFDSKGDLHVAKATLEFHGNHEVWEYDYWGGTIAATPIHWFLTDGGAFQEIGKLGRDAALFDRENLVRPLERSRLRGVAPVWNLRVENYHSFLVGEHGLRVHNGGGGKNASSPKEADDDGRSTSRAYVLEAVSEGPIEGLIGARKGIYLSETPVQNPNNSLNFVGFRYKFRRGNATQQIISDEGVEISNETFVNIEIKNASGPATRAFVNTECDVIRVRLGIQLVKYEEDGDVKGTNVEYQIEIKQGIAPWTVRYRKNLKAKFSGLTEFEHAFKVNNQSGTVGNFQIRLRRISSDSNSSRTIQVVRWISYTEVTTNKLNYPYTAYIGLQFSPDQFSSIPSRQYRVGGRRVRIPTNAIVAGDRGLNFSGVWDGNFYTPATATSDPVWQLFDILTNRRYGLGRYLDDSLIDKWDLYDASVYNNGYVPTGFGGSERRYSCNTQIASAEKAWDVINAFCSACHMRAYWAEGTVKFWQDRPTPVSHHQFTQADVVGDFVYSSTAVRTRHTIVRGVWNDPNDYYQRAVEVVEDIEAINRYGVRDVEVAFFGCTSRSLAIRNSRWILYSSKNETRSLSFTARSYAAYCRPGEVIQVADSNFANVRYGGLIGQVINSNTIRLDATVTVNTSMTLSVMLPNGLLETRTIGVNVTSNVVQVWPPFSQLPQAESNWVIQSPSVKAQLFRVLSVRPQQDPTKIDINCIQYDANKWLAIENDIAIDPTPTRFTIPPVVEPLQSVLGQAIAVQAIDPSVSPQYTLIIRWVVGASASVLRGVYVEYSRDGIVWQDTRLVPAGTNECRFENLTRGTYYCRAAVLDVNNRTSLWVNSQPVIAAITGGLDMSRSQNLVFV